jgi:hypothetical protein
MKKELRKEQVEFLRMKESKLKEKNTKKRLQKNVFSNINIDQQNMIDSKKKELFSMEEKRHLWNQKENELLIKKREDLQRERNILIKKETQKNLYLQEKHSKEILFILKMQNKIDRNDSFKWSTPKSEILFNYEKEKKEMLMLKEKRENHLLSLRIDFMKTTFQNLSEKIKNMYSSYQSHFMSLEYAGQDSNLDPNDSNLDPNDSNLDLSDPNPKNPKNNEKKNEKNEKNPKNEKNNEKNQKNQKNEKNEKNLIDLNLVKKGLGVEFWKLVRNEKKRFLIDSNLKHSCLLESTAKMYFLLLKQKSRDLQNTIENGKRNEMKWTNTLKTHLHLSIHDWKKIQNHYLDPDSSHLDPNSILLDPNKVIEKSHANLVRKGCFRTIDLCQDMLKKDVLNEKILNRFRENTNRWKQQVTQTFEETFHR